MIRKFSSFYLFVTLLSMSTWAAMVDIGSTMLWPRPIDGYSGTTGIAAVTLDNPNEYTAAIFRAPKSGDIDAVAIMSGTVQGSSGSVDFDIRVETVISTSGFPSGTLWATNTNASQNILATEDNTTFIVPLTAAATVVAGDCVAVKLNLTALNTPTNVGMLQRFSDDKTGGAYPVNDVGSGAAKVTTGNPILAIRYSGSSNFIPVAGLWPAQATASIAFTTTTAVDQAGLYWTETAPRRISGAWIYMDPSNTGGSACNFVMRLRTGSGTEISSTTVLHSAQTATSAEDMHHYTFVTSCDTVSGQSYMVTLEPQTTNQVQLFYMTAVSSTVGAAFPAGAGAWYVERSSSTGSYTQTVTQWPIMGLRINGIDDGSGSGGGVGGGGSGVGGTSGFIYGP